MDSFRTSIIDGLDAIGRSSSPDHIWRKVKACANARGYQFTLALRVHGDDVSVAFSDLPGQPAQDAAAVWRGNPALLAALSESRPYTAAEFEAMPLSDAQRGMLAHFAKTFAIRDGLVIAVHIDGTLEGIVMVGGNHPDLGPILRSALHLFAHSAMEQTIALEKAPPRKPIGLLSPREIECLRWAAAGKTDAEIGALLKISARTARFHFENAKKKLGVATRVQAVTEALRINAIAA